MGHGKLISAAIGVGAWLIAAALNILHGPHWLGLVFLTLGAGFIITAGLWWAHGAFQSPTAQRQGERQEETTTTTPLAPAPPPAPEPEERTFVDVTPVYLVGLYANNTSIQADKLSAGYLGKWLRVSGPLGDVISRSKSHSQVTFEGDDPTFMYFTKKWDDALALIPPGTHITVAGKVTRISRAFCDLEDCELED